VVLVVCTVLVFAIAMVIGRQLSGDVFDQIHAEHQAAGGSQFGGIPVNQFGDPAVNQFGDPLTPPPLSSHQKPAATDEFGGVPVGDAFDQIQPDKFTPPPLSSYQGPAPDAGFTPPPLSSHQKPAATDEFGAVMWLAIGLGASVGLGCTLLVFILMGGLK
jgi:hypothetical protein